MGADVRLLSPTSIPSLLATHIAATAQKSAPAVEQLAEVIAEVQLQTQILGASLLHLTVIDPEWAVQTSGFLAANSDGLLDAIEVNFPEGSDSWWRLTMVQGATDVTSANLTLTFEDRIVADLRDKWGPKAVKPGTTTRAQFVKQLVDEVGRGDSHPPIKFVCPSINHLQPVAPSAGTSSSTTTAGTTNIIPAATTATAAATKANKGKGVGHGAAITIGGSPANATQIQNINTALGVANALNAGPKVMLAMVQCAIQEDSFTNTGCTNDGTGHYSIGIWQAGGGTSPSSCPTWGQDIVQATKYFLGVPRTDPNGSFHAGGLIAAVRNNPGLSPGACAALVEVGPPGSKYDQHQAEAQAIIAAYGGATLGSQGLSSAATRAGGQSDVSQLTRGTAQNPDENSWDCISRLAQEVRWYAFSNADTLYYLDGPDFVAQKPAAYISLQNLAGPRWVLTDPATGDQRFDVVARLNYTFDNALALDTPIPTPSGWTTMGAIEAGDVVFGSDGRPTKVLGASPVQHAHDCYRVRFADGTSVIADAGHLWRTHSHRTAGDRAARGRVGIRTTEEIASEVRATDSRLYSHRIRIAAPLELPEQDLPVDPYVLGYWLGDGRSVAPLLSTSAADAPSVARQIRRAGYSCAVRTYAPSPTGFSPGTPQTLVAVYLHHRRGNRHEDTLTRRLRRLNVLGNKHIPRQYLRASTSQRLALLQGIMDSDGTIGRDCQLALADERLALGALELIRGLGFRANSRKTPARGRSRPLYRLTFATRRHLNCFRLPRKADAYDLRIAKKANQGSAEYLSIVSVDRVPSVPVKCIAVEAHDHLYLAGAGMVPTHNTAFTYQATHKVKGRQQRRSRIAKPQTPSELQLNLVCEIDAYVAGDVFVFQNAGPVSGRWVVTDATRNCLSETFTQFTCQPPQQPYPEPQAASTSSSPGATTVPGGSLGAPGSVGGYVNPFSATKGLSASRIDEGCDYSGSGAILAIGNCRIDYTTTTSSFWGGHGGGGLSYTLLDGSRKGQHVYIGEHIAPLVSAGPNLVPAGTPIANFTNGSIEMGWGSGSADTPYAYSRGGGYHPDGVRTAAGVDFNNFMVALGVPACHPDTNVGGLPILGHYP